MSDIVFTVAKGRIAHYASLPGATDSIIVVPIRSVGLVDDVTMAAYANLSVLLAATNDEQLTMGRKTVTGVTQAIVGSRVDITCDDFTWTAATGDTIGALVFCYKPDDASPDTDIIPLGKYDFFITPTGADLSVKIPAGGFLRAA